MFKIPKIGSFSTALCSIVMQNIQIFYGSPVMFVVTCYSYVVSVEKCGGGCNTVDDPYAWICIPNKVKNINVKVFNLMLRLIETRFLVHYEFFECECRLNKNVCNWKQNLNYGKCWCEY